MADLVLKRDSKGNPVSMIPVWYFYIVSFIIACIALVLSVKKSKISSSNAINIIILIVLWGVSASIASVIGFVNYRTARKILIPTSKSYREYKLSRLVMTVPLYAVIINLLVLGICSKLLDHGADSLIFDNDTLIKSEYLILCGFALFTSWIFGSVPLALKTEWNENFFFTFSAISFSGAIFGASLYMIFSIVRNN
jgi:hypothetical protein